MTGYPIPSDRDWKSEPWDLDILTAHEHFAGRSLVEAEALFAENSGLYQEDLMFMPRVCFLFYIRAYASYILSANSQADSDGAYAFLGLVRHRISHFEDCDRGTRDLIELAIGHIAGGQAWFDAEPEIYGRFEKKAARIIEQLTGERDE